MSMSMNLGWRVCPMLRNCWPCWMLRLPAWSVWRAVAQKSDATCLDVVMQNPAAEFSRLYRLVDASNTRPIGVTIPVGPGFLKALKLAASIGLPVRLLPGQPDEAGAVELNEALSFYLYDPMLDAPVEFFHAVLSHFHGHPCSDLWTMLQEDPGVFPRYDEKGQVRMPRSAAVFSEMDTTATPANFVERHVKHLLDSGAECALCPWLGICQGYFKWPDENYSCARGVMPLFERLKETAAEMQEALASAEQGREGEREGWNAGEQEQEDEQEQEQEQEQGYVAARSVEAGRPVSG
jgi:hypothetical protein